MGIPGSASPLLLASQGGYEIQRSLRFNSSDSAYLSRTPASAGNRKTWTWAGWVKRGLPSAGFSLFDQYSDANNQSMLKIRDSGASDNDRIRFYDLQSGIFTANIYWSPVFRDYSAWYHVMLVADTTQATNTNRIKLYINGTQVTSTSSATWPSQNTDLRFNLNSPHFIGQNGVGGEFPDGYLADIHFIDGGTPATAVDSTGAVTGIPGSTYLLDFGEFSATTGVWVPKAYTGTYGTNGFQLKFADNSNNTATTLGKDTSPNGNNWTPNNLSVTAGAGNDSVVDVPTNGTETDTGVGGEVRGNYCTLNPLNNPGGSTLSNGNLDCVTASSGNGRVVGTIAVSSGKWYWEMLATNVATDLFVGISAASETTASVNPASATTYTYLSFTGNKYNNGSNSAYGATYTTNDAIGVALDLDAGTLVFYKNGVSQGTAYSSLSGTFVPAFADGGTGTSSFTANFGQRPWAYPAPSGFKALCTANLPAPVVTKPSTVMDVVTYSGTGSSRSITGLGFSPDWVWIKSRSNGAYHHRLNDTVRGATKEIYSNLTNAEGTDPVGLTAFNSDGFTLGSSNEYNASGQTFVAWSWDAGSSTVTNTAGSISSQVRANASAGFSIVTYTGTGANATVGHGLGVAPRFIILKSRSNTLFWYAYAAALNNPNLYLLLNTTDAANSASVVWNGTAPTSTVFSLGTDTGPNTSGATYVAYCFAPVAGYSSFGSYVANGTTDNAFCYTGFRPRFLLLKASSTTGSWLMVDSARASYNLITSYLLANASDAEGTADSVDFLSNGFKVRASIGGIGANGNTVIWAAFAEHPFQYARAR